MQEVWLDPGAPNIWTCLGGLLPAHLFLPHPDAYRWGPSERGGGPGLTHRDKPTETTREEPCGVEMG